jgi:hypothetical protein
LFENAFLQKQQKETQAASLLASIDDYLLQELDITLPKQDNRLKNRIFAVPFSEVAGGRLDSQYYCDRTNLKDCIALSKLAYISGGKRIPAGYDYALNETNNLYLRVADMRDDEEFDFSQFRSISNDLYFKLQRYEVFNDDLIISIAGTIGKVNLITNIPKHKKVILTENCARIVLNNENILLPYFKLVLQTEFVQKQIRISSIQTTIPKLGLDKILNLYIPQIPDIQKQQQIITSFQNIRAEAQQLRREGREILERAREEVERMVLGEERETVC